MKIADDIKNVYNPLEGRMDKFLEYFVNFFGEKYREDIKARFSRAIIMFTHDGKKDDPIEMRAEEEISFRLNSISGSYPGFYLRNCGSLEPRLTHIRNIPKWKSCISEEDYSDIQNFLTEFSFNGKILPNEQIRGILNNESKRTLLFDAFDKIYERYQKVEDKLEKICQKRDERCYLPWKEELDRYKADFEKKSFADLERILRKRLQFVNSSDVDEKIRNFCQAMITTATNRSSYYIEKEFNKAKNELKDLTVNNEIDSSTLFLCASGLSKKHSKYLVDTFNIKSGLNEKVDFLKDCMTDKGYTRFKEDVKKIGVFGKIAGCVDFAVAKENSPIYCLFEHPLVVGDITIVHELSHIAQMFICEKEDRRVERAGIFSCDIRNGQTNDNGLEYLNELVNEFFALQIYEEMEDNDFQIGISGKVGISSYRLILPFLNNFFRKHLSELKECCMSKDENAVFKVFGREKIEKLIGELKKICKFADNACESIIENLPYLFTKDLNFESLKNSEEYKNFNPATKRYISYADVINKILNEESVSQTENIDGEERYE